MPETATRTVSLSLDEGLHMRPCSLLQSKAASFDGTSTIRSGDQQADLSSIFDLLSLGMQKGQSAEVAAEGDGAEEFVATVAKMFEDDFEGE